jgi:hypothetical protein
MIEILIANLLPLLFLVAAIGYSLGQIRVGGIGFGIAAVLCAGAGAAGGAIAEGQRIEPQRTPRSRSRKTNLGVPLDRRFPSLTRGGTGSVIASASSGQARRHN